jgi:glycosyltransferase involved in cell wall biosynthesis
MKLVINIPCFNEEQTLPLVVGSLPKHLAGISEITVQIVDDGSVDETARVGQRFGCRVIEHDRNLGLGYAFQTGVSAALEDNCDLFVNIDADHQYPPNYISKLIQPILTHQADIVIGNRQPWKVQHFSAPKRFLQWLGNGLISYLLDIDAPDVVSGFRAYSRVALEKLHVTTSYSYTIDTLVQAAHQGLSIQSLIIPTNPPTRQSRLSSSVFQYVVLTLLNFAQAMLIYEPRRLCIWVSSLLIISCLVIVIFVKLFSWIVF